MNPAWWWKEKQMIFTAGFTDLPALFKGQTLVPQDQHWPAANLEYRHMLTSA